MNSKQKQLAITAFLRKEGRVQAVRHQQKYTDCCHNVIQSLAEDLGYRKMCTKWVPRQMTSDLKEKIALVCSVLLVAFDPSEETSFLRFGNRG